MGIMIHQDGVIWSGNGGTGNGIPISEKGQPDGVATLDGEGKVPLTQLPEGQAVNYDWVFEGCTYDGTQFIWDGSHQVLVDPLNDMYAPGYIAYKLLKYSKDKYNYIFPNGTYTKLVAAAVGFLDGIPENMSEMSYFGGELLSYVNNTTDPLALFVKIGGTDDMRTVFPIGVMHQYLGSSGLRTEIVGNDGRGETNILNYPRGTNPYLCIAVAAMESSELFNFQLTIESE